MRSWKAGNFSKPFASGEYSVEANMTPMIMTLVDTAIARRMSRANAGIAKSTTKKTPAPTSSATLRTVFTEVATEPSASVDLGEYGPP
ncbi:hypothetical protein J8273_5952 [Carpediemonas membranifera]|uniref:Uncharacterized protein n=1 Tax=Carpediemonas membranifera TaxID=201153 RepID=A0A8J6DYT0_9EUKA|nr:hypothetical protein J8273_5952 [Carpediemonas membranifera]|eukprot:KAG9392694.1 hypothetical protein J8273_5952 [Carpediemonas membranifera]